MTYYSFNVILHWVKISPSRGNTFTTNAVICKFVSFSIKQFSFIRKHRSIGSTWQCKLFVEKLLSWASKVLNWSYHASTWESLLCFLLKIICVTEYPRKIFENLSMNTITHYRIKVWFRNCKAGNFGIEDEPCPGRCIEDALKLLIKIEMFWLRTIVFELHICQKCYS